MRTVPRLTLLGALLAALAPSGLHAQRLDYRTYWGRDLPWVKVATLPEARSLHQGPSEGYGEPSAIDVLTTGGDLVRLTRDPVRVAYSPRRIYEGGDALAHTRTPEGVGLLTEEGEVLDEVADGFRSLGRVPGGRSLDRGEGAYFVLAGEDTLVRVPAPGHAETFYRSPVPLTAVTASEAGVFTLAEGAVLYVPRAGEAYPILPAGQGDDEILRIVYGEGIQTWKSIHQHLSTPGLPTHPRLRGLLYVIRRGGKVSYVDAFGEEHLLREEVREFPGYTGSDFGYYTFLDAEGFVRRLHTGDLGRLPGDRIRDPDPGHRQYLSFELTHLVLREGGEILVADESRDGERPATGTVPYPLEEAIRDLRYPPWIFDRTPVTRVLVRGAWRLLAEDLSGDERPPFQVARERLPEVLTTYDPEETEGIEEHLSGWLAVREDLGDCLAPLRAARGDPGRDAYEDLQEADGFLGIAAGTPAIEEAAVAHAEAVIEDVLERLPALPYPGARRLRRRLEFFRLRRRLGFLGRRLTGVLDDLLDDRLAGLWGSEGGAPQ